jgi:hypothetical protein
MTKIKVFPQAVQACLVFGEIKLQLPGNHLWHLHSSVISKKFKTRQAEKAERGEQAAEKVVYFVIPSEARNLSLIETQEKRDSSARPRMTNF